MKKMFRFVVVLLNVSVALSYAKPMESIDRYNVVLVHGAGGSKYGLDCTDTVYNEANGYKSKKENGEVIENEYLELIGGYGRKFGDVALNGVEFNLDSNIFGFGADISYMKKRASSAEDMDLKNKDGEYDGLRHWLTEVIFGKFGENNSFDKSIVYLQRPFTNPANSPINNAKELGNRKWQGDKGCASRRALIEEAQEVKANGRANLVRYRSNIKYRQDSLPPSRNILIAHSMGGVASPNEDTGVLC